MDDKDTILGIEFGDPDNPIAIEAIEMRTVKASLVITGRGTVIVVQCLPGHMNASNTQVLIQGRFLKIFAIEKSNMCRNVIGVVLGSQINREEIQVGSSVKFVLMNMEVVRHQVKGD